MIYQLSIFSDIGFSIEQALRTFSGKIAAVLYNFIVYLYNIFMILARAEILNDNYIQAIYNRVGMILGLFMIFKLSFSLIQSLIDPEKLTDKKSGFGSIITRCIVSIVLLGITPSLFKMAFKIQNIIVGTENDTNNIIYKFVVADAETENAATFGRTLATDLYFSFFTEKTEGIISDGIDVITDPDGKTVLETKDYDYLRQSVKDGSLDFDDMVYYLSLRANGAYTIKWDVLFSIGVAIAVIYVLITYCISVATRVIQLAYLQLIAPVPILSYISDPEGAFKNWTKQCMTTYLDLFMRLAIIYFIIAVSRQILTIMSDESKLLSSTGLSPDSGEYIWVKIFLILGLLMFGKRVPELLKDLFPNMGGGAASLGFGLKKPKDMIGDIPLIGGMTNKALGYTGNVGKKAGKWAWSKTGGKGINAVKGKYETWKGDREAYKKAYNEDREAEKTWDKYGEAFSAGEYQKAFESSRDKNGEFVESYNQLTSAKENMKKVINDGYSRDSKEYMQAEKAVSDAQKNHDINREKYKELARREDQLKRYKNRHPNFGGTQNQNDNQSSSSNSGNTTSSQNNQQPQSTNNQHQSSSNTPPSVFGNVENYGEDGNPYEAGYGQFTADNTPSGNNNSTYGNDDGNPYETGHGQFNTTGANNSNEDDNPYTNPNYYNNSGQNSSSNNNDEFDGSNYY